MSRWGEIPLPAAFPGMHLLYLDDSGSTGNATDKHVILAGLAIFERQPHFFSQNMDRLASEVWPDSPHTIEFRGSDIMNGRKHWRGISKERRLEIFKEALSFVANSRHVRLFGAAIHKAYVSPEDPMEFAFEEACSRFDKFLGRLHKNGDTQRGLIILDQSSYETSIQSLAREFRKDGHRWGQLYNMCDVPLFVDSRATRLIQLADLIAYTLRKYYENGDATLFDVISHRFDAEGGVLHGLVHNVPASAGCNCRACKPKKV